MGSDDFERKFFLDHETDSPIIEIQPRIHRDFLLEVLEIIIACGHNHGFGFFDSQFARIYDQAAFAKTIYHDMQGNGGAIIYIQNYDHLIKVILGFVKKELGIILMPERPFVTKSYGQKGQDIDSEFYLDAALKLTEDFAIRALFAQKF